MRCPNCDSENLDSAKFCKKCGTSLKNKTIDHQNLINSIDNSSAKNNTAKYVIVALIIVIVVLAGALIYVYGFSQQNQSDNYQNQQIQSNQSVSENKEPKQAQLSQSEPKNSQMSILSGSFKTDGGLEDKTYASIYVGSQYAGENVEIQIFYSRDGNTLNNGNMVPKTVDSSGYINVKSADSFKYFPDFAEINLYDDYGNLLDTQSVSLNPESGIQTF